MLNGVLILRYQVGIDRLANSCDANFVHVYCTASGKIKFCAKVQNYWMMFKRFWFSARATDCMVSSVLSLVRLHAQMTITCQPASSSNW